ncbi:MAG: hypothetical protein H0U44_05620 [Flavisolibacter sp.]|jgi:hypothetical protein|nr:hypothetical protein [Flavisolibacter sp.]
MKRSILILCCCFSFVFSYAQEAEEEKGFNKEKMFFGGNFGLSFGDLTLINVSPQVGYRFNQTLAAGIGINGQFVSLKRRYADGQPYSKTSQGVIGLNVFGRVYPIQQIMLQVQPEANYIFGKQLFYGPTNEEYQMDAAIIPSVLIGAGVVIPAGRGSFIAAMFYDVLQDSRAPYGSRPFMNFGYNISLR